MIDKNVTINITSVIKNLDNSIEEKSSVHIGKLYFKDNKYIIFYNDSSAKVKITIYDNKVTIRREEFLIYTLEFEENKKTSSIVKTELLGFDINIITNKLDINANKKEIMLHIDYDVINNNEVYLKCDYVFLIR